MSNKLIVCQYQVPEDNTIYITKIDSDGHNWVVERGGHLLSKTRLEFTYKPLDVMLKSSFVSDLSFTTPEQAYQRWLVFYNNSRHSSI